MAESGKDSLYKLAQRAEEQAKKVELAGIRVDGILDKLAHSEEIEKVLRAGRYEGKVQSDADWVRAMMEVRIDPDLALHIWDQKENIGRDRTDRISGQSPKP